MALAMCLRGIGETAPKGAAENEYAIATHKLVAIQDMDILIGPSYFIQVL
jgi:hypothetical protein